jgi:hypothetical protein
MCSIAEATAQPRQLKASAAQIRVIARVKRRRRVFPTRGEREMKHVQLPLDGEVLPRDPADDDPLLPRRSAATIWLALAVACTAAWTVAAVALAIWQS